MYNYPFSINLSNEGVRIHKGWYRCSDERILSIYEKVKEAAIKTGYLPRLWFAPDLYIRKWRGGNSYAACARKEKSGSFEKDGYWYTTIILSDYCLNGSEDFLKEVLVHELAHACTAGHGHDSVFLKVANTIGKLVGVSIGTHCHNEEENSRHAKMQKAYRAEALKANPYRYELYCSKCGAICGRYKTACAAVKHPERWQHKRDKGILAARRIEP